MSRTAKSLLLVVLTLALAAAEQESETKSEHKAFAYHKTAYFLGGGTKLDNGSLNTALSGAGFHPVDDFTAILGGGFGWRRQRMIHGIEFFGYIWQKEELATTSTKLYGLGTRLNIGVNLLPKGPVLLYPQFGLGLGGFRLRLGNESVTFADAVAAPINEVSLWQRSFVLEPGLGVDFLIPKRKHPAKSLLLGIRGGYSFDVSDNDDWRADGVDVTSGPKLKASGPYVRITVGSSRKKSVDKCGRKGGCKHEAKI
jgi:hypothetical protein